MIEVRVEDLAFYSGHAVIRPATATLGATTPLLRRFELAGGQKLLQQLAVSEPLPVGSAVVTSAGDLPVELLVHAIVISPTERVTREGVRRALRSALQRTREWQLADVAIPPLGLGAGNLAIEDSAEVIAGELRTHAQTSEFPRNVTLVAETPDEAAVLEYAVGRSVA